MFIKSRYQGANAYVDMTEGIDRSMLASLGQRRRRRFLTAIWLVLILFVAGAWFASRPAAFQWLSRVAPPVAHFLLFPLSSWNLLAEPILDRHHSSRLSDLFPLLQ